MFYKKKYCLVYLTYNTTKNYYNTGQCIFFIDLFIINTSQKIVLKKYTMTRINDKKGQ